MTAISAQQLAADTFRDEESAPSPRSTIDNAITAAFRRVVGWCPWRDGAPEGMRLHSTDTNYPFTMERHRHRAPVTPTGDWTNAWRWPS